MNERMARRLCCGGPGTNGRTIRFASLTAGTLSLAALAFAQEAGPLTLDDCIRLALSTRSGISVARHQREIAALGLTQARAALLPQARLSGAFTYNSPVEGSPDMPSFAALNGVREYGTLFTVTQEVDISGRLRAARTRARADEDVAAANLVIAERDLRHVVTVSYYRLLLARRLSQVARDALAESQAFEARTKLLFEKGEAARADVVKAAAQTAFLQQSVSAADLEAEIANHELASLWTTDVAAPLPLRQVLDDALPAPPEPASTSAADQPFLRRPELTLLDGQRRGFLAEARRSRAERLPQASVIFQYGIDSLRFRASDRGYAAFFSLDVPVFDWFRARSAARQFEREADQVEISRRVTERTLSRDYQDALSRVRRTHEQIATTRAQVQLSEENLRLSRVRYDGGEGSALDVVAAQGQLAQARTNYYTALVRCFESQADLRLASGE